MKETAKYQLSRHTIKESSIKHCLQLENETFRHLAYNIHDNEVCFTWVLKKWNCGRMPINLNTEVAIPVLFTSISK